MTNTTNKYHRDGTVTFWSVYQQSWTRCDAARIDHAELAAMNDGERKRIARLEMRKTQ